LPASSGLAMAALGDREASGHLPRQAASRWQRGFCAGSGSSGLLRRPLPTRRRPLLAIARTAGTHQACARGTHLPGTRPAPLLQSPAPSQVAAGGLPQPKEKSKKKKKKRRRGTPGEAASDMHPGLWFCSAFGHSPRMFKTQRTGYGGEPSWHEGAELSTDIPEDTEDPVW
jgi:hypothetical protein